MRKSTKELALCSMLAALSVVLLGALFSQLGDSRALILALRACQN